MELTKWPRLVVAGKPVTPAQAEEIILRTQDWYDLGTNDREWELAVHAVAQRYGYPPPVPWWDEERAQPDAYKARQVALAAWKAEWGVLDLAYLDTDRIASAWIGGPKGWVDWDGSIGCRTYNIGKWPSEEEVLADWQAIAAAWPFLELRAQLWPDEGEAPPVVEFRVANGDVLVLHEVTDPLEPQPLREFRALYDGGERGTTLARLEGAFARVNAARLARRETTKGSD
jgi:hypothetical protein